jgi:rhodanese-related sulfurtransferase
MTESAFLKLVQDAKARISECEMVAIKEMVANDKIDGLLIDVRESHEHQAGHIPGSIHISKGLLEAKIETKVPNKSQKIYLYCGGGYRSALSADSLQKMGYKNVFSIEGGYGAW